MSRKLRRRSLFPIAAFSGFSSTARAQSFPVFRYDDDVSALSDPAARKSLCDALKFIPLGPSPDRYLSLGDNDRERVEYSSDAELGARFKSANAYEMRRLLVTTEQRKRTIDAVSSGRKTAAEMARLLKKHRATISRFISQARAAEKSGLQP